jgi:hypothetical protein
MRSIAVASVLTIVFAIAVGAAAALRPSTNASPPWCSYTDDSRHATLTVPAPGKPGGHPLYTRSCGPGQAVLHHHEETLRIRGGHCARLPGGHFVIRIGLRAAAPAAPAEQLGLFIHHPRADRPGTFRLAETENGLVWAQAQVRNVYDLAISGGTITIGRSMRSGTFAFRLADTTRATGNWTCD